MCTRELMELVYGEDGAAFAPCGHDHSAATAVATEESDTKPGVGRRRMLTLAGALGATIAGVGAISATPAFADTEAGKRSQPDSVADALRRSRGSIQDLTYRWDVDFPVLKPYVLTPEIDHYATVGNQGFNANKITIDEHTGTHMDGPSHLVDGAGVYTDQITVDKLVTTLVVIDISARAATNADTTLQVDDVREYERRYGRIPTGSFVALNTGWGSRIFTRPDLYTNRDTAGNPHFPGLGGEALQWLITNRGIFGAGTDTPSLDAGVNLPAPEAHRALLGAMRYGVENIANISTVPQAGSVVSVGVMKHAWGYGGPVRMLAIS